MMLPILISVSLAPGSYFFSALAALALTAAASTRTVMVTRRFARDGIVFLPVELSLRVWQAVRMLASAGLFDFIPPCETDHHVGNTPIDQQQRACDHQRTHNLADCNVFSEYKITEEDRSHRDQQRHQHDIAGARSPNDLKEDDIGKGRRHRAETNHRGPRRCTGQRKPPRPLDDTGDYGHYGARG